MKKKVSGWFRMLAAAFIASLALTAAASAQADKYKPGDKIEYKVMGSYPEKWEKGGTFIGTTPGGSQPIIREKPSQFYPEGFERASSWDAIRPMGAQPQGPARPEPAIPGKEAPPNERAAGDCAAMLTQDDVLGFLQKNLGNDPFRDSAKKERTERELAATIRACGVNFRYETLSPFGQKLSAFGATSIVTFPIRANFGPPTKQPWYVGTWTNNVQSENYWSIIAAKTGFLTISSNGTYIWKLYGTDPPAKYVRGKWRPATPGEMAVSYQGGAGVVLLNGKQGYDWIVRQDRETTLKGRWIVIADINTRQQREFGFQK